MTLNETQVYPINDCTTKCETFCRNDVYIREYTNL